MGKRLIPTRRRRGEGRVFLACYAPCYTQKSTLANLRDHPRHSFTCNSSTIKVTNFANKLQWFHRSIWLDEEKNTVKWFFCIFFFSNWLEARLWSVELGVTHTRRGPPKGGDGRRKGCLPLCVYYTDRSDRSISHIAGIPLVHVFHVS